MNIINLLKQKPNVNLITLLFIILLFSFISSFLVYKFVAPKPQRIAVVDLAYLNHDFVINLSKKLIDKKVSDEKLSEIVKDYVANIELLIKDIEDSGEYVLFQKQTVISEGVVDITDQFKEVLLQGAMVSMNKEIKNEEIKE